MWGVRFQHYLRKCVTLPPHKLGVCACFILPELNIRSTFTLDLSLNLVVFTLHVLYCDEIKCNT